jgi:glycosyltransferase involved in cell wall biosynthesis
MEQYRKEPAILYFGNDWFADNRTSSHHIARWLAKRFHVYYIECPGMRRPRNSGRDFKRILTKVWRFLQGAKQVEETIKVRTLLQIPFHRFALIRWLNRILITSTLRWLIWREGLRNPIAWFMIPHLSNVVGRLGERLSVYYCIDDYATLPDVNQTAIRRMDEELTRKCDLVFVSAESLRQQKLPLNPRTYYSPHGVDVEFFSRAQGRDMPIPQELASLPGPIMGFIGLIEEWVDLDLMAYLAENRPQWTFVMIGRVAIPIERLPKKSNLHFIGQIPYETLPTYGKAFDVAIIPFHLTPVIMSANPLKLREYLAMGKPVVSVSTPEIDKYTDVVEIARSRADFLAKLDFVLSQGHSTEDTRRRMDRVASESWEVRLNEVLQIVDRHRQELLEGSRGAVHAIA